MNKLIILFAFVAVSAWGQSKVSGVDSPGTAPKWETLKTTLKLSAYEQGEMQDFEAIKKQLIKVYRSQDSLQGIFLQKFLTRNGVDLTRISNHSDSTVIKPDEIILKLKHKQ